MAETYCGKTCAECAQKEQLNCQGCKFGPGRQFGGDCELAKCVMEKGHETCGTCSFMGNCSIQRRCAGMPEERIRKREAEAARKAEVAWQAPILGKWLWIIFWLIIPNSIASVLTNQTVVAYVPGLNLPGQIISAICSAVYGFSLLKLASVERSYKKAGIFVLITAAVSVLVALITGTAQPPTWTLLLTLPALIVAWIGEYHMFHANAAVLKGVENELSEQWCRLWKWTIGLYLGLFGCAVIMLIFPLLGALALFAGAIALLVVGVKKLVYLYRTAKVFREFETI